MWQVSLFLLDRDKLPPAVLTALQAPLP